jgi:hypothetical protein
MIYQKSPDTSLLHVKSEVRSVGNEKFHVLLFHSNLHDGLNEDISDPILAECIALCEKSGGTFAFSRTGNSGVFSVQLPEKLT